MSKANAHASVTLEELLVSSLAQTDAFAKRLIEKDIIAKEEFLPKIARKNGRRIIACSVRHDNKRNKQWRKLDTRASGLKW